MKIEHFAVAVLVVASLDAYFTAPRPKDVARMERSLGYVSSHLHDLSKVTPFPLHMSPLVAMACASAAPINPTGPHEDKFFDVYISPAEASVILAGAGTYPEGCVILKRKYSDPDGKQTELYTGMIKRAHGYNPTAGDWEYFVLSGDGQQVRQSGRLQSCMACHQNYAMSDYVTRAYFSAPASYSSK